MESAPAAAPDSATHAVEELLRVLGKTQRALQMYLPNNPVYQRAMQQLTETFAPVWGAVSQVALEIHEDRITFDDAVVLQQAARSEGMAWQLYKDGLRRLVLMPGVEDQEIVRLLQVLNRCRHLPTDATDDLLTLLWEQEFACISYTFIEALGEGIEFLQERGPMEGGAGGDQIGSARTEVEAARSDAPAAPVATAGHGIVDLADFDATPYFLDEAEVHLLHDELEEEYRRDIRQAAIDALLDILESQRDTDVRREVIGLLETILPTQLSIGGFHAVARILRELRLIASRAQGLDQELYQSVLSFEERLSSPEILDQLFRVLADTSVRTGDEDVGEVLRELKASALPSVLRHLGHVADAGVRRVLEASVESLARTQPAALGALITAGDEDVVIPAIGTAARLGITQLVPAIVPHLQSPDEAVRSVSVRALGELATPSAISALESALDDDDAGVRQAVLGILMQRGGSGGLRTRLESMLFADIERSFERSERRALFEAYGVVAGPEGTARLRDLVQPRGVFRRKVSSDVRASALYALAKAGGDEARSVVLALSADKDPVVRTAANSVLREWQ
jgi:HEAT repeat protein